MWLFPDDNCQLYRGQPHWWIHCSLPSTQNKNCLHLPTLYILACWWSDSSSERKMYNYSAAYWPILILCVWAASSFTTILCVLGTNSWGRKSTCHGVSQSHTTHASIEKFTNENLYLSNHIKKCKVCHHSCFTFKQTWTVYDQAWALFTLVNVSAKTNSLGKVTVVYV